MTVQDDLLKVILPHFESYQRQGQEEACELSLEASANQLRTKISSLELCTGLEKVNLNDENKENDQELSEVEEAMADLFVGFIDASVATETTSDLQDSVDRVLSLIAAFGVSFSTPVGAAVISRAIQFSAVLLERVRGHACILLGKIAASLKKLKETGKGDNAWIEESLVDVEEALQPRLQDKGQAVRCHAIKAAGNFFIRPEDEEVHNGLLEAMLWSMAHDPSVNNRIVAVRSAPVNAATMDALIARVRDVKPKVRVEALSALGQATQIFSVMTEAQIVDLIRSGLTNRCETTKKAASKMIGTSFMKSAKYDPIVLLHMLNVLENEEEANRALEVIMEAAQSENSDLLEDLSDPELRAYKSGIEKAAVPIKSEGDELKPETLFYLRARCKHVLASEGLTSGQKDTITSKLIPDVPLLCEVFGNHASRLMRAIDENDEEKADIENFKCLQLLQLAELANLNEEGSRRHFAHVMKDTLSSIKTPDDLVEGCIQALRLTCLTENDMVDAICAIIANINEEAGDDGNGTEDDEDFKTMKTIRILSILTVFLETASSQLSSNPAVAHFAKHIVPAVTKDDPLVREAAVGCFGKLGLFTDEQTIISEFKPILLKVAACDEEKLEIRAQALLALADWTMLFSECVTSCTVGDDGEQVSLTDLVRQLMDDSRLSAVCIAAEVAAKLLFAGRVCDSEWYAKLLSIFFHPHIAGVEEEDENIKEVGSPVRLQQLLTLFFPAVCMKEDTGGRDAMIGSIQPLLELIYVKSPTKVNSKSRQSKKKVAWPIVRMVQFVCQTAHKEEDDSRTVQAETVAGEDPADATGAVSVAATEAVDPNSTSLLASIQLAEFLSKRSALLSDTDTRNLCKLLGAADFDPDKEEAKHVKALKDYVEELGMHLVDEISLKYIAELTQSLDAIEVETESEEEPEESRRDRDHSQGLEEGDEGSDDNDELVVDLSDVLISKLADFKIDDNLHDDVGHGKKSKSKGAGKGRKDSDGSYSSRRSQRSRLRNAD